MTPARILIVEDEWLIARDYAMMLKRAGHLVIGPVSTAPAALQLIQSEQVDVVLLDFHLGGDTSSALAHHLNQAGIPYLVVTGHPPPRLPPEFAHATFIEKPVDPQRLLAAIVVLTERR